MKEFTNRMEVTKEKLEEEKLEIKQKELDNKKKNRAKKIRDEIVEWIFCFIVAVVIYLLINYFLGTISGVKQSSMSNTFLEGEKILIQRPTIWKKDLNYGDVITFCAPDETNLHENINPENITAELLEGKDTIATYPNREGVDKFTYDFMGIGKKSYIKRIIGKAGDHIQIHRDGTVTRNEEVLVEPYIKDGETSRNGKYINVIVPEGTVYVMGDNRLGSLDSRALGCIPIEQIDGYVIGKVWPLNRLEFYN